MAENPIGDRDRRLRRVNQLTATGLLGGIALTVGCSVAAADAFSGGTTPDAVRRETPTPPNPIDATAAPPAATIPPPTAAPAPAPTARPRVVAPTPTVARTSPPTTAPPQITAAPRHRHQDAAVSGGT
jgi:hypothetical protein